MAETHNWGGLLEWTSIIYTRTLKVQFLFTDWSLWLAHHKKKWANFKQSLNRYILIYSFLESYIGCYKKRTLGNGYGIKCDASGKTLGIYLEHGERIGNIISTTKKLVGTWFYHMKHQISKESHSSALPITI